VLYQLSYKGKWLENGLDAILIPQNRELMQWRVDSFLPEKRGHEHLWTR
jgi:hypothetical protein